MRIEQQLQQQQVTAWEKIEAVDEAARLARGGAAISEAEMRAIVYELAGLIAERQGVVNIAEQEGREAELSAFEVRERFLRDRRSVLLEVVTAHKQQICERELQAHVLLVDGWRELAAELDEQASDVVARREIVGSENGELQPMQAEAEADVCGRWKRLLNVFPPPHNLAPEPGGNLMPSVRPDLGGDWLASFEVEEWWPGWLLMRHAEAVDLRRSS